MIEKLGGRKSVWFLMSLMAFVAVAIMMRKADGTIDAAALISLGTAITMMLSASVYGNVQSKKATEPKDPA